MRMDGRHEHMAWDSCAWRRCTSCSFMRSSRFLSVHIRRIVPWGQRWGICCVQPRYVFVFNVTLSHRLIHRLSVTLTWETMPARGTPPTGTRTFHQCILTDGRMFIFGGLEGRKVTHDVYILDMATYAYLPQVTSFQIDLNPQPEEEIQSSNYFWRAWSWLLFFKLVYI